MPTSEEKNKLYRDERRRAPKVTRRMAVIVAIGVSGVLWVISDSPVYFARSMRGKVVDATTNKPMQGVVVMAEWMLEPIVDYLSQSVRLHALETVTDAEGNYTIPEWGPRLRPPGLALAQLSPQLVFIYPGYYPEIKFNGYGSRESRSRAMIRTSDWNGKTAALRQFDGNWMLYRNNVRAAWSPIWGCGFECPKLIARAIGANRFIDRNKPKDMPLNTGTSINSLSPELRDLVLAQQEYGY